MKPLLVVALVLTAVAATQLVEANEAGATGADGHGAIPQTVCARVTGAAAGLSTQRNVAGPDARCANKQRRWRGVASKPDDTVQRAPVTMAVG